MISHIQAALNANLKIILCTPSFSTIFDLFKINEDFHHYLDALTDALKGVTPFQGCET